MHTTAVCSAGLLHTQGLHLLLLHLLLLLLLLLHHNEDSCPLLLDPARCGDVPFWLASDPRSPPASPPAWLSPASLSQSVGSAALTPVPPPSSLSSWPLGSSGMALNLPPQQQQQHWQRRRRTALDLIAAGIAMIRLTGVQRVCQIARCTHNKCNYWQGYVDCR
jgi:hypothetical protein